MKHLMIDLETLGRPPAPALLSIGAVLVVGGEEETTFHQHIDPDSSVVAGGRVHGGTVLWWLGQSEEARRAITNAPKLDEGAALASFIGWYTQHVQGSDICVWGNGASFDVTGIESAFARHGLKIPWEFWQVRCYRTLKALRPDVKLGGNALAHDALSDARVQAQHLVKLLEAVTGRLEMR